MITPELPSFRILQKMLCLAFWSPENSYARALSSRYSIVTSMERQHVVETVCKWRYVGPWVGHLIIEIVICQPQREVHSFLLITIDYHWSEYIKSRFQAFSTYDTWDWIHFDSLRLSSTCLMGVNINWHFSVVWAHDIIDFINNSIWFCYTKNTNVYVYRSQFIWVPLINESLLLCCCPVGSLWAGRAHGVCFSGPSQESCSDWVSMAVGCPQILMQLWQLA